jgi:hypothetical protein
MEKRLSYWNTYVVTKINSLNAKIFQTCCSVCGHFNGQNQDVFITWLGNTCPQISTLRLKVYEEWVSGSILKRDFTDLHQCQTYLTIVGEVNNNEGGWSHLPDISTTQQ